MRNSCLIPPFSSHFFFFLLSKPSDAPFCIFVLNSFTSLWRQFPISSQSDPQSGLIYIRLGRDSSIHSVHLWLTAMKFTVGGHRILNNSDFVTNLYSHVEINGLLVYSVSCYTNFVDVLCRKHHTKICRVAQMVGNVIKYGLFTRSS